VADAKASAADLHQVDSWIESVCRLCAVSLWLMLKRAKLIDAGAMDGLIAWEKHVQRVDVRTESVRLSCDSGLCLM